MKSPSVVYTMSNLGREKSKKVYPELPSSMKAAHVKSILGFFAYLTDRHDVAGCTEAAKNRAISCWGIAELQFVMGHNPRWMPRREAERCLHAGRVMLLAYQKLAVEALQNKHCLYKVRPKTPDVCHIVEDFGSDAPFVENPRFFATWMEEDFMGKVTDISSSCNVRTVMTRPIEKYILLLVNVWPNAKQ